MEPPKITDKTEHVDACSITGVSTIRIGVDNNVNDHFYLFAEKINNREGDGCTGEQRKQREPILNKNYIVTNDEKQQARRRIIVASAISDSTNRCSRRRESRKPLQSTTTNNCSESSDDDQESTSNRKRSYATTDTHFADHDEHQPARKKGRKSSDLQIITRNRAEIRNTRKSLLLVHKNGSRRVKTLTAGQNKKTISGNESKKTLPDTNPVVTETNKKSLMELARMSMLWEPAKEIIKAFPEAKIIKQRIEGMIKRDAAKELLNARVRNDGKAIGGDVEKLVRIYHSFGYRFVTHEVLFQQATLLVKTPTYKTMLARHGIESIQIGTEDENVSEQEPKDPSVDNNDIGVLVDPTHRIESNSSLLDGPNVEVVVENTDAVVVEVAPKVRNKGGRPKGSTKEKLSQQPRKEIKKQTPKSKLILDLTQKAAELYVAARDNAKLQGMKRGKYEMLLYYYVIVLLF
jgi:hypothetical protein